MSAIVEHDVTPFGGIVAPCQLLNCPIDDRGLCHHCGFRADPKCVIEVCRYCYSTNLRGAEHGLSLADGPESGQPGCLWPCRHEVQDRETECGSCHPPTGAPF